MVHLSQGVKPLNPRNDKTVKNLPWCTSAWGLGIQANRVGLRMCTRLRSLPVALTSSAPCSVHPQTAASSTAPAAWQLHAHCGSKQLCQVVEGRRRLSIRRLGRVCMEAKRGCAGGVLHNDIYTGLRPSRRTEQTGGRYNPTCQTKKPAMLTRATMPGR